MDSPSEPLISVSDLDREAWCALEDAVAAFEAAYRNKGTADPASFVLESPPTLRLRSLIELVKVDLECHCERGESLRVEEYFERWPELTAIPEARRELVEAECVTRCGFGELVGEAELKERVDRRRIHLTHAAWGEPHVVQQALQTFRSQISALEASIAEDRIKLDLECAAPVEQVEP